MTVTITHQYVQTLRLCLVDMCRLSHRCVDYAIKAFELGRPEIYANARENPSEMDTLQRDVTEYALEIINMEFACGDELRFAVSSLRIADALQAMCRSAGEIAEESIRMFDDCAEVASEGPGKIGDLAIRFVRLCTVALFEEAIGHAELVLRANRNGGVLAHSANPCGLRADRIEECQRHSSTSTRDCRGNCLLARGTLSGPAACITQLGCRGTTRLNNANQLTSPLLQLRVLRFSVLIDGNLWVGISP
jgi:hypothetical protein